MFNRWNCCTRLRGKTYNYKILYSSITRLFLLPKFDENHIQFIVSRLQLHFPHCFESCRLHWILRSDKDKPDTHMLSCSLTRRKNGIWNPTLTCTCLGCQVAIMNSIAHGPETRLSGSTGANWSRNTSRPRSLLYLRSSRD